MVNLEESLGDILNRKEELCEELKPYFENNGKFDLIRHPLVYSVPHNEVQNALVNKQYEVKSKEADKLLNNKEYASYIFLHEKPFRMNAFIEVKDKLSDEQYWSMALSVWTNSENIWQNKKTWKELLTDKKRIATKTLFMSYDDLKEFNDLPKEFTVYRGYHEGINEVGYSYTLDEETAKRFTKGHKKIGKVLSRVVSKDKIFAYTNDRNESEIIII
jgi:hypothetical protein